MPSYDVATEDLAAVEQRLAAQVQELSGSLADVGASCDQLRDEITTATDSTQAAVQTANDELLAALNQSQATADGAQWTGPDSEQFRALTATLIAQITELGNRMLENVEQHRSATQQLQTELDAHRTAFAQEITKASDTSAELQNAIQAEHESYEQAFAGGFTG